MNHKKIVGGILLVLLGLALEPSLPGAVNPVPLTEQRLKLVLDTRALVRLRQRQKRQQEQERILQALEQVAIGLCEREKRQLAALIHRESRAQDLDPRLIIAMIKTESEFRKRARSRAGAHGLMQVRFPTAREVAREIGIKLEGRKSLYNPQLNIKMGAYYFGKMIKRFENLELALTAYNIGPTALRKRLSGKRRICKKYSRKVLSIYQSL